MRKITLLATSVLLLSANVLFAQEDISSKTAPQHMWHPHFFHVKSLSPKITQSQCEEIFKKFEDPMSLTELNNKSSHNEQWYKFGPEQAIGLINDEINFQLDGKMQKALAIGAMQMDYKNKFLTFGTLKIIGFCAADSITIPENKSE